MSRRKTTPEKPKGFREFMAEASQSIHQLQQWFIALKIGSTDTKPTGGRSFLTTDEMRHAFRSMLEDLAKDPPGYWSTGTVGQHKVIDPASLNAMLRHYARAGETGDPNPPYICFEFRAYWSEREPEEPQGNVL